jgi:hypothetical protein
MVRGRSLQAWHVPMPWIVCGVRLHLFGDGSIMTMISGLKIPSGCAGFPHAFFAGVNNLHPAVADRLPAVLLAGASALAAVGKRDQLQALVAFAAAIPNRISQAAYQRLNELQAGVA